MRAFIAIIIKDLRVRFSSPMELVFFILLPLVFTVALAGGSMAGRSAGRSLPLVLLHDEVGTAESRAFITTIETMPGVVVREVDDPTAIVGTSEADLLLSLSASNAPANGLPFTLGFRLSPWRGSAAGTARQVGDWLQARQSGPGDPPKSIDAATPSSPGETVDTSATRADAPSAAATGNAGQIITWALVSLLGLGAGFITERRRGTMRRVNSSPAPRGIVTAASVTAEMLGALVQIGLLVSFGSLAFGLPWFSHPLALVTLSAAFCLAGASLGMLLGAVCRTSRQAGSLALGLSLVLAVFGGCWYPSALFPASLRQLTGLDPAGWAMDGFLAVLSPTAGAAPALRSAALLLGFGLVVLVLAAAASRRRRASMA